MTDDSWIEETDSWIEEIEAWPVEEWDGETPLYHWATETYDEDLHALLDQVIDNDELLYTDGPDRRWAVSPCQTTRRPTPDLVEAVELAWDPDGDAITNGRDILSPDLRDAIVTLQAWLEREAPITWRPIRGRLINIEPVLEVWRADIEDAS